MNTEEIREIREDLQALQDRLITFIEDSEPEEQEEGRGGQVSGGDGHSTPLKHLFSMSYERAMQGAPWPQAPRGGIQQTGMAEQQIDHDAGKRMAVMMSNPSLGRFAAWEKIYNRTRRGEGTNDMRRLRLFFGADLKQNRMDGPFYHLVEDDFELNLREFGPGSEPRWWRESRFLQMFLDEPLTEHELSGIPTRAIRIAATKAYDGSGLDLQIHTTSRIVWIAIRSAMPGEQTIHGTSGVMDALRKVAEKRGRA